MITGLQETLWVPEDKEATSTMPTLLHPVPREDYDRMLHKIEDFERPPTKRGIGKVVESNDLYTFRGRSFLLEEGVLQEGIARTTDNPHGFQMTRLYSNSADETYALLRECGLRE